MGVDSLPPPLLGLLMILQSGKSSILRWRVRQSRHLQGIIRGTTEALHRRKITVFWETVWGDVHDAFSGDEAVEVLVFRLMHGVVMIEAF